jgi:hypothetical protein
MTYKLIKREIKFNKTSKYHYQVIDENGDMISERRSNREYVAATIDGKYYYGRMDLVGKGDYRKYGETTPIAYLETKPTNQKDKN